MSLISFSPLQDGVTGVNATATNTPLNTIYNDYNGNITDANISANAAIAGSKLASNGVTADKLATSALTLGYAEITSNFTTTSVNTYVDVTGLSVSVTVPSGGRRMKVTLFAQDIKSSETPGGGVWMNICEDGTIISQSVFNSANTSYAEIAMCLASKIPTAGSHTYKVQIKQVTSGTCTLEASSIAPGFILVELI